jgi:hypothetical protein
MEMVTQDSDSSMDSDMCSDMCSKHSELYNPTCQNCSVACDKGIHTDPHRCGVCEDAGHYYTWYCGVECAFADRDTHKLVCGKSHRELMDLVVALTKAKASAPEKLPHGAVILSTSPSTIKQNTPPPSASRPKVVSWMAANPKAANGKQMLMHYLENPFSYIKAGNWLRCRNLQDGCQLLMDAFRLQERELFMVWNMAYKDSIYDGGESSGGAFAQFLNYLEEHNPEVLPEKWFEEDGKLVCFELAAGVCSLTEVFRAAFVQDRYQYDDDTMPEQLRIFAEVVHPMLPPELRAVLLQRLDDNVKEEMLRFATWGNV